MTTEIELLKEIHQLRKELEMRDSVNFQQSEAIQQLLFMNTKQAVANEALSRKIQTLEETIKKQADMLSRQTDMITTLMDNEATLKTEKATLETTLSEKTDELQNIEDKLENKEIYIDMLHCLAERHNILRTSKNRKENCCKTDSNKWKPVPETDLRKIKVGSKKAIKKKLPNFKPQKLWGIEEEDTFDPYALRR